MKNIAVAGTGYVGLATGTCFADMGNKVTCIDISEEKIEMLRRGEVPIYEPGLSELIERNVRAGRLKFTTSYEEALSDADYVFICVGTPSGVDGEADLQYVRMAAESVAKTMTHPTIVINKSTVPVGTGDWVADIITRSQPDAHQLRRGQLPRIHPRRLGHLRLHEPGPRRAGQPRPGSGGEGGPASPAPAHPHRHDRPAHRRDDQVCQQRLSGHQDQLHQRDRGHL